MNLSIKLTKILYHYILLHISAFLIRVPELDCVKNLPAASSRASQNEGRLPNKMVRVPTCPPFMKVIWFSPWKTSILRGCRLWQTKTTRCDLLMLPGSKWSGKAFPKHERSARPRVWTVTCNDTLTLQQALETLLNPATARIRLPSTNAG